MKPDSSADFWQQRVHSYLNGFLVPYLSFPESLVLLFLYTNKFIQIDNFCNVYPYTGRLEITRISEKLSCLLYTHDTKLISHMGYVRHF